jgi:FkbM family methyltransferase|tara:strand:+ start:5105 stop:7498 length:2394 start_codon:yes stop_codon:yes gene_type:complete
MSLITKSLHYLGKNHPELTAVQIGGMDGIHFDDTRGFFDMYEWKTIIVEPIPELFKLLKENLKDRKNLLFENSAIGKENSTIKMLNIPLKSIEENDLHPGYKGMSAVYPLKNGFGSTYWRDKEVKEKYGVDIEVPCITFDELVKKYSLDNVNILISDAEGSDWDIFKTIELDKYDIKFIRLEYMNLTDEEKNELKQKLDNAGYIYEIKGQDIDAVKKEIADKMNTESDTKTKQNYTIVSGLWDLTREGRDFNDWYLARFKEFLKIDANMILFLPPELVDLVWEVRSKNNTYIKIMSLEDLKNGYFQPHWENAQKIRNSKEWLEQTGPGGWLKTSPQATLEYYNPIVMSKMFMLHDASIFNNFQTDYFYWLDAGITSTVPEGHLTHDRCFDKINKYADPFLFLSYDYISAGEIHGFEQKAIDRYAGEPVRYVCRGGLFGGHKDQISQANSTYYALLNNSLAEGLMGTEESLFAIMAYNEPYFYRRYRLDDNGLIVKFTEALLKNTVKLEELKKPVPKLIKKNILDTSKLKTNLYILTFNFPDQLLHTIESMKKVPEWLEKPNLVLLDNSTDTTAQHDNKEIAEEYNFEYIWLEGNKGICGGRQAAAEHFHKSDADYYFFFEDDMTSNPPTLDGQFCRNGLRKYIPNLYILLHEIMLKEEFDYLKMSFTEVYWDNNIQTSWYNVPQDVRTKFWPDYDQLPVTGKDDNAPRTKFNVINNHSGIAYIDGEITYTNWPMIMSKKGNQKVFIDTKWDHPYEQTWMSHVFQLQKEDKIRAGVLLASPIWHERIKYYKPEERREN